MTDDMRPAPNEAPLVSILIRSMDRPSLKRALESAAGQRWPNLEIVVVAACGRSHRSLPDAVLARPLRVLVPDPDRRLQRAEAANVCLVAARGEWLNFLDDDDELLPDHVTALLSAARAPDERVLFSVTEARDAKGKILAYVSHPGNHAQLYFHNRATSCATLFHRSLVDEGVRFDPEFTVLEDHDFLVNCATRTYFRLVETVTCIWNAENGASGCGAGINDDYARRNEALAKLRHKWSPFFQRLMGDADSMLFNGQQYLKSRKFVGACEYLERALGLRPDDVMTLSLCGMANYHIGNIGRADALVTQALKHWPGHPALQKSLALIRSARSRRL